MNITGLRKKGSRRLLAKGENSSLPKDVNKTYELLETGELEGIFQLESSGMKQISTKI